MKDATEQSDVLQEAICAMDDIASKASFQWGDVLHKLHFHEPVEGDRMVISLALITSNMFSHAQHYNTILYDDSTDDRLLIGSSLD